MNFKIFVCCTAIFWTHQSIPASAQAELPLVEHKGTIDAADFIALFERLSLTRFTNIQGTLRAFRKEGFTVTKYDLFTEEEPQWEVSHDRLGISGKFGLATIFDIGLFDRCALNAYVNSPDEIDREAISAPLMGIEPARDYTASGQMILIPRKTRDGRDASIVISWPYVAKMSSGSKGRWHEQQGLELSVEAQVEE